MKNIFKSMIISTGVLVISFAAGFASQYRRPKKVGPIEDVAVVDSQQQQLLDSLGTITTFNCKAKVQIKTEANDVLNVNFRGQGDAADVSNITLGGHLDFAYNGISFDANLGYFDGKMFFDYNENYFKLETSSLLSFINMLPELGVNMEMPLDLEDFDISVLQDSILSMEDKTCTPSGEYYFIYQYNDDVSLYVKTNEKNEFTGIRTDNFFFKGNLFKLDIDLDRIPSSEVNLVNPLDTDKASLYQDFAPVFTIFDDVYRLTQKRQTTVNIAFDLKKFDEVNGDQDIFGTSIDLSIDKDNGVYGIDGEIYENARSHKFLFGYADNNIYANYNNLKVSISTHSIYGLVEYALKKIGDDTLLQVLTGASASMSDVDILSYMDNAGDVIKTIGITETSFTVSLDPSVFNIDSLDFAQFEVVLRFNSTELETLTIKNLKINGYGGDIVISFVDFKPVLLDRDSYVALDPALSIVEGIDKLLDDTRFRIEFDATIDKIDPSENDITFDGGFQFDIENNLGYGELDIVDGSGYLHNIKLDVPAQDKFVFKYNDTMCGKFETQTIIDLFDLVVEVVQNPDEHFMELFGSMLNTSIEMPVVDAISNGDYGMLLAAEIIKDITVTDTYLEVVVALDLLGMDDQFFTVRISYDDCTLVGMTISGIELDGANITANFYIMDFDDSLEATRLDPYEEYIDFSQIKLLLELGINTSKFEYYHLSGEVALSLGSILNRNIPIDMKIRNNKGEVDVAVEFSSIPVILLVNTNSEFLTTSSRKASLYYSNGLLYVTRVDRGSTSLIGGKKVWTLKEVCTPSYFLDNIMEIFCKDILGLSDGLMSTIGNLAKNDDHTIHYEKILNNFIYNETDSFFYFDINIAELAGSSSLKSLILKVNTSANELSSVEINLNISVLITIKIGLNMELVEKEKDLNDGNRLTEMEAFIAGCEGLETNTKNITMVKA